MTRGRKAAAVQAKPVDGLWELPDDWSWERLAAVSAEPDRGNPSSRFPDQFRYVDVGGVGGDEPPKSIASATAPSRARQFVQSGDTLFSCVRVNLRRTVLLDENEADVASTAFSVLRPLASLDPRYLKHWLSTDAFVNLLLPLQRGGTPPAVLDGDVRSQPIPVPSRDTQQRIVARIDELFAELDDGEVALGRARADLITYRKSLLRAAVMGELTADWRGANPPQETGGQHLTRILAERRARWEAEPRNGGKRYKEPAGIDTEGLRELPEGWAWASLDQIVDRIEAGLNVNALGRPPGEGETGIVKVSAVTWWDFNEDASKTLFGSAPSTTATTIRLGDFLISRANTLELVGAPAIVRNLSRHLVLSDKVLRLVMPDVMKDWLFFVLRSSWGRSFIEARSSGNQLSMRNLSQDNLRQLPVPLPPVAELRHVVDTLSVSIDTGSDLDRVLAADAAVASRLRQSILSAAFRGELLT